MAKYSKKVILDYISGNDIIGYDIDELERDYEFMLDVFKLTHDKNMYHLCDNSVKSDVNFIIKLIEIFKNDLDFCADIVDEFSNNCRNEILEIEANIALCNTFGPLRADRLIGPVAKVSLFYYKERKSYCILIEEEKDQEWKKNFAMGFWLVLNIYKTSSIIKDFFAKKMLEEIYEHYEILDLEKYLHKRFKRKDDLLKIGVKRYILNSIFGYDECLSGYLEQHSYLLCDIEEKINLIINKWDDYKLFELDDILDIVYEMDDICFSDTQLVTYIAKEFELPDLVTLHSQQMDMVDSVLNDEYYFQEMSDDEFDSYISLNEPSLSSYEEQSLVEKDISFVDCDFKEKKILLQLKKKVQDLISNGIEDDYVKKVDNNCMSKVLSFHKIEN